MSLDGTEDQLGLPSDSYSSIVPEGEEGTPPYGQYPTETRFRRPDYKFYKTLDDSKEFLQRVQPLPPPPPPPQQQQQHETGPQQNQQNRSAYRRPVTAYARWPPRHRHQQQQPPPREPEPGWRPIFPEPDLSTPRPSRPVTAPSTRSSAAAVVSDIDKKTVDKQLPEASTEAPTTASKIRQQQAAPTTPSQLAVVDFLEVTRQPSPPHQPPQPPPPQPASSAARFYRPKTAPSRVATVSSGVGLQIQGHRLLPAGRERAASAKPNGSSVGGVKELSEAYDRALNVYGWRMEVPGDPFGIKQHLIPDRKPVSVTVPEPTVKPLPPRVRRTNRFTFFHTTAPRVVMSFDIHPNFTSEQYSKARMALIKQGKWDYRYRDFSFMY